MVDEPRIEAGRVTVARLNVGGADRPMRSAAPPIAFETHAPFYASGRVSDISLPLKGP